MTSPRIKRALKQLERAWKRVVFRGLGVFLPGRRAEVPQWDARPHRVLYLRYDRIGDMIMATPLLRAIARSHPTIELDVLASPSNAVVLMGNPHVRRTTILDRKRFASFVRTMRLLRRQRYDAVIDGMVLQPSVTMLMLMLATGARYRIGIGGRANDFIYTLPVPAAPPNAHQILQSAVTAAPFGVDVRGTDWRPELFLDAQERARAEETWRVPGDIHPRVLVNIAAGEARRRWPAERVVAAIRAARDAATRCTVLVMAPPSEIEAAEWIARGAGARAVVPGLRDAFALVATADVVFTPDTSVAHAASAFAKPSVVMMIGGSGIFEPYETPGRFVYSPGPTLESLEAQPVIDALASVVRAVSEARAPSASTPR
ncbi:MAG TPA: glycosyltransferase family 9 protein [Gemmatimonadaceae bacterium]|nr:glycosyltransferase family 9 protein [Gemmatimonadaceae bacterium]